MTIPQEAVEAAANALYGKPICLNPECEGCEYERGEVLAALAAALPAIEKEIRAQAAADIWEYWDACGDLIDDRDSARQAIDAIAAQIAEGADHA